VPVLDINSEGYLAKVRQVTTSASRLAVWPRLASYLVCCSGKFRSRSPNLISHFTRQQKSTNPTTLTCWHIHLAHTHKRHHWPTTNSKEFTTKIQLWSRDPLPTLDYVVWNSTAPNSTTRKLQDTIMVCATSFAD